ncbi:MAG TPA: IclR family transcriptional regulator [Galbitalea sp.]
MAENQAQTSTMRSLERALEVLSLLQRNRGPMRLTEVAKESGLHLATTQRILGVLSRYGYVSHDGHAYSLGVASLLNAHAFLISNSLSVVAAPVLQELALTSGLTASMSIRVGFFQVLLLRFQGAQPLRYQLPVGEQLPLHLGGARVLAAAMPIDELDAMLASLEEVRLASGETLTIDEFRDGLKTIAEQGYAYGVSQREMGAASIAVPIAGRDGLVVASLQLSGLEEDFDPAKTSWYVSELTRASAALTRRMQ